METSFSVGMLSCYGQKGDYTENMSKITKENTLHDRCPHCRIVVPRQGEEGIPYASVY